MIIGSLLSYVGWFFFAAWSLVVGAVNVVVFGRDLIPSEATSDSEPGSRTVDHARPAQSRTR